MPSLSARVRQLIAGRSKVAPPERRYRVLMQRGSDFVSPPGWSTTRAFEADQLRMILQGGYAMDDLALAKAAVASATATKCLEYRCNTTAALPFVVLDSRDEPVESSPLDHVMADKARLIHDATWSLLVWGRAYVRKRHNTYGYPTGLEWVNPLDVQVMESARIVDHYLIREPGWRWVRAEVDDVLLMEMFDPDPDGRGMSKVEQSFREIGLGQGITLHASAFFVNGAQVGGFIFLPEDLSDDQMVVALDDFRAQFKGAANAHRVGVLRSGDATFVPSQSPPKDLAMVELDERNDEKIAARFEVDLALVGMKAQGDPLGAGTTYSAKEVAHLRNVALPFARHVILPALNEQWASHFRDPYGGRYRIEIDERQHPALAEAALTLTQTANSMTGQNLADYDEARAVVNLDPREGGYFKRPTSETLATWTGGIAALNESRRLVGLPPISGIPDGDDLIIVQGQPIPASRLYELANANVDRLKAPPAPAFGLSGGTQVPTVDDDPEMRIDENTDTDTSFWVALSFPDHPDLIAAQNAVKSLCGGMNVSWNATDDFHITLAYAPKATEEQVALATAAIEAVEFTPFDLRVGSFNRFDTPEGYAMHFRIRECADLRALQRQVYDACIAAGMAMSSYSVPEQYIPHITMGYSQDKPPRKTWTSKYALRADTVVANHGDKRVMELGWGGAVNAPEPEPEPGNTEMPPEPAPITRAAPVLELAVSFAENAFIRAARRELSSWLTTQDELRAEWLTEDHWLLPLAMAKSTPADAARILRNADYSATRKADAPTRGFVWMDNTGEERWIGLAVEASDALTQLQKAACVELDADPLPLVIPLCALPSDTTVDLAGAPEAAYPLIAATVVLADRGRELHRWELKSLSSDTARELDAWERKAARSVEKARHFEPDALRAAPIVPVFIQVSLEDEEADLDAVFRDAARMLTRSFGSTRTEYVAEMLSIIGRAQKDEVSRQKFGGNMRSIIRRYGLIAMRDGMNEVGYDPESFSQEELAAFRAWQAEQSGYVTNFSAEIFKVGISERAVRVRAEMWANMTLESARELGLRLGGMDQRFEWVQGPTREKCPDCVRLNGQVHTMKAWIESGYTPTSRKTKCKSFNCLCQLKPTDKPERGDY